MRLVLRAAAVAALLALAVSGAAASSTVTARWRISYQAGGRVATIFDAAVAVGPRQAWAVGRGFYSAATLPVVRRWNGRAWQAVPLPRSDRACCLTTIAGSSPDNVWLFGYGGLALRWNGRRWSDVRGLPTGLDGDVNAGVTTGPSDTWAFDDNSAWHYNGVRWHRSRPGFSVAGASAVSARDVWAIGFGRRDVLAHWNGRRWRRVALPSVGRDPYAFLSHVLALPGGSVWVTGGLGGGSTPVALHYQHGRWQQYERRGGGDNLGQAVSDGSGGIWAVYSSADDLTTMVHIHGSRWQQVRLPAVRGWHTSVTALVRLPGSGTLFAAGSLFRGLAPVHTRGLILQRRP